MVKYNYCCTCKANDIKGIELLICKECEITIHKKCYYQCDILEYDLTSKILDSSDFLCTKCSSKSKIELKCNHCNAYKFEILKEYSSRDVKKKWYHISCINKLHKNKSIELQSSDFFIEAQYSIKIWLEEVSIELNKSKSEENQYEIDEIICQVINEKIKRKVVLKRRFTKNEFIECILLLVEKEKAYDNKKVLLNKIFPITVFDNLKIEKIVESGEFLNYFQNLFDDIKIIKLIQIAKFHSLNKKRGISKITDNI